MTNPLRPAYAAAAATCSGIGLARFSYVPIFPAMVAAGWVSGGEAGLLGAINLAGYLAGALGGRRLAARLTVPRTLDAGMALAAVCFAACGWNGGLAWLLCWRGAAGFAGGMLMALAGPATQAAVPPDRRGMASGIVVGGVGTGISLASLLVPLLLPQGIALTWIGLALLVLALWAFAHPRWPRVPVVEATGSQSPPAAPLLLLTYALHGAGMVPPMIYLADLAARGRSLGVGIAALVWLLFGLGAIAGTLLAGRLADRLGGRRTLPWWLLVQVAALALALPPAAWLLVPAALLSGFAGLGITAVTLAVAREVALQLAGPLWARATAVFALSQAATAFALAALFAASGESHLAVFAAGLLASLAALTAATLLARQA